MPNRVIRVVAPAALLAAGVAAPSLANAQAPRATGQITYAAPAPPAAPARGAWPEGSVLNLAMTQAHPREVYAEVARQSRAQLRVYPRELWDSRTWDKIDVSFKDASLWTVLRELTDKTGLVLQRPGPDRDMVLSAVNGATWRELPGSESGAFYVVAQSIYRNHSIDLTSGEVKRQCNLRLTLYAEPKVRVLRGPHLTRIEEAFDENGTRLGTKDPESDRNPVTGAWSWGVSAILVPPADAGKTVARLRGYSKLLVQTRSQTVEIPDVLHSANVTREVGGRHLRIREVRRNSTDTYTVTATLSRASDEEDKGPWNEVNFLNTFRMLDAEGNPLIRRNYGGSSAGPSNTIELSMVFARDEASGQTGEPAKLVWEVPLESAEMTVPFEFRGLPLP